MPGGITRRTAAGLSDAELETLVEAVGADELGRRIGMGGDRGNVEVVAGLGKVCRARTGRSASRAHDVLAWIVDDAVSALRAALGDAADTPTFDDLTEAAESVSRSHSTASVRLALAAGIEWRFSARSEIRQLVSEDGRFSIADEIDSLPAPARSTRCAPYELRRRRRERRTLAQEAKRIRQQQRDATQPSRRRHGAATNAEPIAEESAVDQVVIEVDRLVHPRLPEGVDGITDPVGKLGTAFISWGRYPNAGKRRPVIIIGATVRHLWVRPLYSRDAVAGRWRSVKVGDFACGGLTHDGFVAQEVRRLRRSSVMITEHEFTVHDWNRVCRGEVHD
jgi:hypothetical protein